MATHEPTFQFPLSSTDSTQLRQRLITFFEANGYTTDDGDAFPITLRRGQSHASWWSSDMSRLKATLRIDLQDDDLHLDYQVIITGQHLTDEDQAYWSQEAQKAHEFAIGDDEEPTDYRLKETQRAKEVTSDVRSAGLWATAIVMGLIIVGSVIADRLGWL